jgi:penicillin V acylase-like amidase (Ntn superfamily)
MCKIVFYHGPNDTILTARSMDWKSDISANLWIFPKGIKRNGRVGLSSIKWKSKYGTMVTSIRNMSTADDMKEKGLVGN